MSLCYFKPAFGSEVLRQRWGAELVSVLSESARQAGEARPRGEQAGEGRRGARARPRVVAIY